VFPVLFISGILSLVIVMEFKETVESSLSFCLVFLALPIGVFFSLALGLDFLGGFTLNFSLYVVAFLVGPILSKDFKVINCTLSTVPCDGCCISLCLAWYIPLDSVCCMYDMSSSLKNPGTVFTTLHFLCKLRIGPIS